MTEISAPVQAVQLWRRYRQLNARRLPVPEDRYYAISQVLGRNWTRRRVQLMLDRLREDEGIKAFLDRDGPEPYLKGDAHGDLLYWSKGRYVRQRHERRQDRDGE